MQVDPFRGQLNAAGVVGALTGLNVAKQAFKRFRQVYGGQENLTEMARKDYAKRRRTIGPARGVPFKKGYDRRNIGYYNISRPSSSKELKFFDSDLNNASIGVPGDVDSTINGIVQGVAENQRIGRIAYIKKIAWRYQLTAAGAGFSGEGFTVRLILYQDTQTNGVAAAVSDVLEVTNYQSFNNLSNKNRFKILMDRTHTLDPVPGGGTVAVTGNNRLNGAFYKNCHIPIEFSGSTGSLSEMRSNNIGVIMIGNTAGAELDSKFRIRFTD